MATKALQMKKVEFDDNQLDLMKRTIARGATNDEFTLFVSVCQHTGLDPFLKQIHMVKRYSAQAKGMVMSIQTGIDGYRLIADRTGKYIGQRGPEWCGEDGVWKDVWLASTPPAAARVGALRKGFAEPVWGVARYSAYVQKTQDGSPNAMWRNMDAEQLAKCAEALALRKAFPNELSPLRTNDEMGVEDVPEVSAGAVREATKKKVEREMSEAIVEDDAPIDEPDADLEQEPAIPMTAEVLSTLVKEARRVFKTRTFVKEAPAGSKAFFFVDQKTISAANMAGSILIQKDGVTKAEPEIMQRLFDALKAELEAELARAS